MLRLTGTERAVAEVTAVAEHVASLTAATAALQLRPDVPSESGADTSLIPLGDERSPGEAAGILTEIRDWARQNLGVDRAPAIWRGLAQHPRLLEST